MNKVKVHYNSPLAYYEIANFLKNYIDKDTVIVCIGTDRCIGDCLGPIVGSLLKSKNFPLHVYGTISDPIHALNINKRLEEIKKLYPRKKILGIDACLGDASNIGEIQARDYPVHPGKGVGKTLPDVGQASIIGIVDTSENNEFFNNNTIRLDLVISMAKVIVHALIHAYYLSTSDSQSIFQ